MKKADAAYQWQPDDYARNSTGQERWARELLPLLALEPADTVLDVGCGDGRITALLATLVPVGRIVGTDLSGEMIDYARANFTAPNLSFVQADAGSLPFRSEFSVVFSNAVLHWIREPAPVLAGIASALKPGGRLVAQCGGRGNGAEVIAAFESIAALPRWRAAFLDFKSSYGFYDAEQYGSWLAVAGLEVEEACLLPKILSYPDREAFVGWLRTAWHPYTSPVAAAARTEFLAAVADHYLASFRSRTGSVQVKMVRLQIRARKPAVTLQGDTML